MTKPTFDIAKHFKIIPETYGMDDLEAAMVSLVFDKEIPQSETEYLNSTEANKNHIERSIAQLEGGDIK